jgi:tRNA (cmo5U34)-methyltransferase
MNEFDIKANDWDKDPQHVERAQAIAKVLLKMVPVNNRMRALEYGAGTGLLSFILKDKFSEITLMDSSPEMIRVVKEKIESGKVMNIRTLYIDLEKEDFRGEYDIIYNQMVMHHISNIERLFDKFYKLLKPGGYLAIADLYAEDGSFHGGDFKGHKGFDVIEMMKVLKMMGFKEMKYQNCYMLKKTVESGAVKEFPVFLLVAVK